MAAGALAVFGSWHATAFADDVQCSSRIGNLTIDGNVLVSAPCELDGTTVKGNVHLYAGGSLLARGANIDGSIQAENAVSVDVAGTHVNGNIQLDKLVGAVSRVEDTVVGGSIQLKDNRSTLEVVGNEVDSDVQAFDNTGGVLIVDNTIDGNLQCKSNNPPPVGGNNQVNGNKEDQCANLAPGAGGGGDPGPGPGPGPIAGDVHCPANLGAVTVDGNVLVAAACRLDGTNVKGNVILYSGGSLVARSATIIGNVQAEDADFVDVASTSVDGNIQLDRLVGDVSRVERTNVGGSIQLKANRSRLEVVDSDIDSDLQAFDNTGGVLIADNIIDGNLQCKGNQPPPVGGDNQVRGNKEDQCANLMAESGGSTPAPGSGNQQAAGGDGGGGNLGFFGATLLIMMLALKRLPRRRLAAR